MSSEMDAKELKFWVDGDEASYVRMHDRHTAMWKWIEEQVRGGSIKRVVEVGGSWSPIPKWLPKDGYYINIDMNVMPIPSSPNGYHIIKDFRDVDPETLGECDLLCAFAVVEHCPHYSDFFEWALKTKAKRIVVSFFNHLSKESFDSITRRRAVNYNTYSREGLDKWLYTRGLSHSVVRMENDDVVDIAVKRLGLFDSRIALANKMGIQIRHDSEQLRELFDIVRATRPDRIIEVGSFCGGTSLVFGGLHHGNKEMLLIDLCDRKKAVPLLHKAIDQLRQEGVDVTLFAGDSASPAADGEAAYFVGTDFLYIDGCHRTRMVVHDYLTYRKYVRDGGLIGFHDVSRPKLVKRAWDAMTKVWDKQGLRYEVIGGDEWDRKTRPWATGIGLLQWDCKALENTACETELWEWALSIDKKNLTASE